MAVFKKGLLGGLSGTIGPIIVAKWKGVFYVRSKPKLQRKTKKTSPAKLAAQKKFSFANKFLALFSDYIVIGFKHLAIDQTEANAALAINYHTAIAGEYPDLYVDFSKLKLSKGSLPELFEPQFSYNNDQNKIDLIWEADTRRRAKYDDQVTLVVYSEEQKRVGGKVGIALRRDRQCSFKIDFMRIRGAIHLYLILTSLNRKAVSDTQYLGVISF